MQPVTPDSDDTGNESGKRTSAHGAVPGRDYNLLPYLSLPAAFTQPAHLGALAALHGLQAPVAEQARVLELGCASGGNLIPLAARFPGARFLGLDLSQRQINDGQRRIAALGLDNIVLRQGDLVEATFAGDPFDYIICHGVFSWVPKVAQDAILRLCATHLAAEGIAAISYNVLPGWHLRQVVRDICLRYAGNDGTPQERVRKARAALEQIASSARPSESYGMLVRAEAKRIGRQPASYILGEFLAPDNTPCLFSDFVAAAGGHGLGYLCEADLQASTPELLDPDIQSRMAALGGEHRLATEQHADFLTGRPFRRSILVRAERMRALQPMLIAAALPALHVASQLSFDAASSSESVAVYRDSQGRAIVAETFSTRRALGRLADTYPATLTWDELLLPNARSDSQGHAKARALLGDTLLAMLARGQATASTVRLQVGRAPTELPRAWPLARLEVAEGQRWVTTLQHVAVPLPRPVALLLSLLDGNHDRRSLTSHLVDALRRGEVKLAQGDPASAEEGQLQAIAAKYVERALVFLAANALLEPVA